jgi:hypothetical protein
MPTRASIRCRRRAALVVVGLLFSMGTAPAQQSSDTQQQSQGASLQERSLQQRKAKLEVDRLGLEVDKLKQEVDDLQKRKAKLEVDRLGLEADKLKQEVNDLQKRNAEAKKLELEAKKLQRETDKIDDDLLWYNKWGPSFLTTIGSVLVGIVGGLGALWLARRNALAALDLAQQNALDAMALARHEQIADIDQATHEKRLESYPTLVNHTSPLAIYFPQRSFDPPSCDTMGRKISDWYFASGLLLSAEARDAYFLLARGLTRASGATKLNIDHDPEEITLTTIEDYRERFKLKGPKTIEEWKETVDEWTFGPDEKLKPDDYKDYVFLQTLSSNLRTMLTEDIRSRRRPGDLAQAAEAHRRTAVAGAA